MNVSKPASTNRSGVAVCFAPAAPVLVEVGWADLVPVLEPVVEPAALVDEPGTRVEVITGDVADSEVVAVPTSTVK